jgi:hypothetical protein
MLPDFDFTPACGPDGICGSMPGGQ